MPANTFRLNGVAQSGRSAEIDAPWPHLFDQIIDLKGVYLIF
jgi:hypothetical protein